jgi:hypothetical protein
MRAKASEATSKRSRSVIFAMGLLSSLSRL